MTNTLKAALKILTFAVQTDIRLFDTFVDVHTVHVSGSILVAFRTLAFKGTWEVYALSITLTWIPQTLVVIYALVGVFIVNVPPVTQTLEAAGSVHALSMFAHGWHQLAHVDFLGLVSQGIRQVTWCFSAERDIFTLKERRL